MLVGDVMTRGVEYVAPTSSVQEAAIAMAEHDIGAVLVGAATALVGILTDRDIIIRAVTAGRDLAATAVQEVMSASLFLVREDDTVEQALERMARHQVRRLPVVDAAGRVVGIVARSDLVDLARRDGASA
jgi:CBS domain-containing protein